MAKKNTKSQAEKTVSATKGKKNTKTGKKATVQKQPESDNKLPVRLVSSLVLLALAVLFSIILFTTEGALLKALKNVLHGLIGRAGFVVSIPVLFYLFVVHAFNGKRPVRLRTVCLLVFVFLCSCISHLNDVTKPCPLVGIICTYEVCC